MSFPRPFGVVRPLALALSAALIVGVTAAAFGQSAAPVTKATKTTSTVAKKHARKEAAEDRNEMSKHLQDMTKRLKLTPDQAAKVKSIMEAHEAQASELRAKY